MRSNRRAKRFAQVWADNAQVAGIAVLILLIDREMP
jgi:hypothetical protein